MDALKVNFNEIEEDMNVKVDTISPNGSFERRERPYVEDASPIRVDKSSCANVKEINVDGFSNVEPLPIPRIRDTRGKYTKAIVDAETRYNCAVVPLEVLNIPKAIVGFAEHDIIMLHGVPFTSNNSNTSRNQTIRDYCESLIEKIYTENPPLVPAELAGYSFSGNEFIIGLMTNVNINGKTYITRLFNNYEIRQIKSYLCGVAYVRFLETDEGDLYIVLTPKEL